MLLRQTLNVLFPKCVHCLFHSFLCTWFGAHGETWQKCAKGCKHQPTNRLYDCRQRGFCFANLTFRLRTGTDNGLRWGGIASCPVLKSHD
eukprot:6488852-Amphidinium_carterae.2